jgi:hypothetical protein
MKRKMNKKEGRKRNLKGKSRRKNRANEEEKLQYEVEEMGKRKR